MTIEVICPNCQRRYHLAENQASPFLECENCNARFPAPGLVAEGIPTRLHDPSESGSGPPAPTQLVPIEAPSPESVVPEWSVGDWIEDLYEVKEVFSRGGMGLVYRVHHRKWKQDMVVKVPKREYYQDETDRENFIREANTWVDLGLHPHIVSCYYVRTLRGIPLVFAEYVAGGSLSDWIKTRRLYEGGQKKALERILDIAIQMAWGLGYAHERGVIHQDVKPANVMMTPEGTARITDFGLAKARALSGVPFQASNGKTIQVTAVGMSRPYCSPEQARGERLSRATDIWSWGVSLLEMFIGERRWMYGQAAPKVLEEYLEAKVKDNLKKRLKKFIMRVIERYLKAKVKDPTLPEMPPGVADLLKKCFALNPHERPQTFQEVAEALKEVYQEELGKPYPRPEPKALALRADSLNNRAISYLDLGREEDAVKAWEEALKADPHHLEATFNLGLWQWQHGVMTDEWFVKRLEEVRTSHRHSALDEYLLALVHIQRGALDEALPLLEEAVAGLPEEEQAEAWVMLGRVYLGMGDGEKARNSFKHAEKVAPEDAPKIKQEATPTPYLRCLRTLEGHMESVRSVAFSPDGRFALSGSADKTLRLWEVATGQCLHTFEGHTGSVNAVGFSPDGRFALSGSWDNTLRLWEVSTGQCLRTFKGHFWNVNSVAFSPDGSFALSGSYDKTLRLWEVATGQCLRIFEGHTKYVFSVAFSFDGRFALSGSDDKTLRLWEVSTGQCLRTFEGHTSRVNSVAFSPDGRFALSGSWDKTLRLWEVSTGQCLRIFEGHTHVVNSVAFSPDGRFALSGSWDKTLRLWEVSTGRCLRTFEGHTSSVRSVAFSPDGRFALSGSEDHTLRLWEVYTEIFIEFVPSRFREVLAQEEIETKVSALLDRARSALSERVFLRAYQYVREAQSIPGYERASECVGILHQLSLYGQRLALRGAWHRRTFEGHTDLVHSVAFSPDGRFALSGSVDKTLRLWEVYTGQCLRTFKGHGGSVLSVAFSPDGCLALSGSWDKTLRLWEVSTGRCLRTFRGHTEEVFSVAFSSDGRFALSGNDDNTLRLWEVSTGQCLRTFKGHRRDVYSVAFSPDGRFALSGSGDETLRLWEVSTGQCLRTFRGHMGWVNSVAFSPDGRFALSGSWDNTLRLWEVSTGRCLRTFKGHTYWVHSVAFSPDGRFALSGSGDNTLRLWEVSTGKCLRAFKGHTNSVHSVAFSPDGRFALSGSSDKTLRLWEFDWELMFPEEASWDEGARPYLEIFLALRNGKWNEEDFRALLKELGIRGYGWLRPEGVRRKLEEMTKRRSDR